MSTGPAGHMTPRPVVPPSGTGGRTPLRRFLRTYDGVSVDAVYEPGAVVYDAGTPSPRHPVFVIAHGFTGDLERPHVRRAARALARHGAVVTFSFRGHGASGGRSTVGDREVLDLAAAVAWARERGHARVVTVGFSLGGSVVLRHAALHTGKGHAERHEGEREGRTEARTEVFRGAHTDAVVSVSAPARWYYRGTAPMRRLHWLVTRPAGRAVGRYGLRTRIHHRGWDPVPPSPVESVPLIAPTPLLVVHGDRDAYFPLDHPRTLAEASGGHADLWLERGMGHAENAADDRLLERIGRWAAAAVSSDVSSDVPPDVSSD